MLRLIDSKITVNTDATLPKRDNLALKMNRVAVESIQIVHRDILKRWFWDKDYGETPIPRTDSIPVVKNHPQPMYVPLRELCRHFDGHMHIICDANANPPIDIPPGFFEGEMKITYCAPNKEPGTVHLNPLSKTHFAFDGVGADYHWVLEDIPMFWKDKIKEIKVVEDFDKKELLKGRNESHARKALMYHKSSSTIYQALRGTPYTDPPVEWIERGYRAE